MKIYNLTVCILIILISFALPYSAQAEEAAGRFSIENYYSSDTASSHNFNITTVRLRLDVSNLKDKSLDFHFKGRERIKFSSSDINHKIPEHLIDSLNFEYLSSTENLRITAGRQIVEETAGGSVDGINAKLYFKERTSVGLFGGLKPDPYMESFNSDYITMGAYYRYKERNFNSSMGFVHDGYKWASDRDYMFLQLYCLPVKAVNFHNSLILDIGQESSTIDITSLNLNTNIIPAKRIRISLYYSQFRSVKLKRSMNYNIDRNVQRVFNLRLQYKLFKFIKVYASYNFRNRDMDHKTAHKVQFGFNGQMPYLNEVYFDTRYSRESYFTADNSAIFFEVSRQFFDLLDTRISIDYQQNKSDIEEAAQDVIIYNISFDCSISRAIYLSVNYEYLSERDFNTSSVFTKIGFRF